MIDTKFVFVTGGVLSSLGKGLSAAAIGALLECHGYTVVFQKLDPYLNVDPGTMSPFQHGEVYVTDDGAETDLDMGHYERFTNAKVTKKCNYTSGRILESVIAAERRGDYDGQTVQIVPHVTDKIKEAILQLNGEADIALIELGGTVGDIEGLPFLEAVRQLRNELVESALIHLTLVPYLACAGEIKTKPTQHSVKELLGHGLVPDFLICRSSKSLDYGSRQKIASFCNVKIGKVISAPDAESIYEVPIHFRKENLDTSLLHHLGLTMGEVNYVHSGVAAWQNYNLSAEIARTSPSVRIGIVGKYTELGDSYKSIEEALHHAGAAEHLNVQVVYFSASQNDDEYAGDAHGILVPGGFGNRGIEGKMEAIEFARKDNVPFLGICLGMQLAALEFARSVAGLEDANSEEFDPTTTEPLIYLMREWFDFRSQQTEVRHDNYDIGGTMRLGSYPCRLVPGTKAYEAYQTEIVSERHRHRYEFNQAYRSALEDSGFVISGLSPDGELVEVVELADHPWFVGCQFHPEFQSRPMKPHPLFRAFVRAAMDNKPIPF